jgi:hypothetical protein
MRGRKVKYHRPHRISAIIEESDFEAAEATGLSWGALIRLGLKQCSLQRPEIILKLAKEEDRMAEEHREEMELHQHRAQDLYARVKQSQLEEVSQEAGS